MGTRLDPIKVGDTVLTGIGMGLVEGFYLEAYAATGEVELVMQLIMVARCPDDVLGTMMLVNFATLIDTTDIAEWDSAIQADGLQQGDQIVYRASNGRLFHATCQRREDMIATGIDVIPIPGWHVRRVLPPGNWLPGGEGFEGFVTDDKIICQVRVE